MSGFLSEEAKKAEDQRAVAIATLKQMRGELERLKRRNQEAVDQLMADNRDQAARARMEATDAEIAALKEQIAEYHRHSLKQLLDIKRDMERKREAFLDSLHQDLIAARAEQEHLAADLIPRAQAALDDLIERKKSLEARVLTLMSRINEMRQGQIETADFELE